MELNVPKETIQILSQSMFSKFWELYPRKIGKSNALIKWKEICANRKRQGVARPTWEQIENSINDHIEYEWKDKEMQFIPHPATWLNQSRWLDEVDKTSRPRKGMNVTGAFNRDYDFGTKRIERV